VVAFDGGETDLSEQSHDGYDGYESSVGVEITASCIRLRQKVAYCHLSLSLVFLHIHLEKTVTDHACSRRSSRFSAVLSDSHPPNYPTLKVKVDTQRLRVLHARETLKCKEKMYMLFVMTLSNTSRAVVLTERC
jgi:hypothetical protein